MIAKAQSDLPEKMDDPGIPYNDVEVSLHELGLINRWLGGYRTTRIGIAHLTRALPPEMPITILDIGAGGTDLRAILRPLSRRFEVTALDINPHMREFALRHGHAAEVVLGSAHNLSYPDHSFDIVHASLFLHHCTEAEARQLLRQAVRLARLGVVINDLQRHSLALAGITLLTTLFAQSPIVRNDGPLSVRRGFTRHEMEKILSSVEGVRVTLSWRWAFRWCICLTRTEQ